jgi:four helix bundle protein
VDGLRPRSWTGCARGRERAFDAVPPQAVHAIRRRRFTPSAAGGSPHPPQAVHEIPAQLGSRPRRSRFTFHDLDRRNGAVRLLLARVSLILSVSSLPSRPSRLAPVLAALAASTAAPGTADGLVMARKQAKPNRTEFQMAFQVEELSLELIEALVPLMPRIKQRDKSLEDQLRRAASSIGLNCAEAAFSDPGNRRARLFTAAGSASETRHALRQAVAWRLVTAGEAERAVGLVGRIVAILWRMTRG